jgi:hypothetical protein
MVSAMAWVSCSGCFQCSHVGHGASPPGCRSAQRMRSGVELQVVRAGADRVCICCLLQAVSKRPADTRARFYYANTLR